MASLLTLELAKNPAKNIAFFRFKILPTGEYLITNDVGWFAYLETEQFMQFVSTGEVTDATKQAELVQKGFYKTETSIEVGAADYAQRNSFLAFGPALHMIVTTLRCNHKCQYCHAAVAPMSAKDMDMTIETATKVVDTIFYTSQPHVSIEFQGGESLVNWDVVVHIVEYAKIKASQLQKKVTFALVSNLSLMTEEKLQYLVREWVGICTSMDGDKETHNWQRTYKEGDSYALVAYWIKRANAVYAEQGSNYRVGALLTLTKPALKNYKKIIDAYVDLGLDTVGLRWLNPYGFAAAERDRFAYTTEEFITFLHDSMDYIIEINKSGKLLKEMLSAVYLYKILKGKDPNFMDLRSPSGVAIGGVAYNHDGKVYASDESRMLGRMGIEDFLLTPMLENGEATYRAMARSPVTRISVEASTLDGLPGYNDHVYKPYLGVDVIYSFTQDGNPYSNFAKDERNIMQLARIDYLFEKMRDPEVRKIFESWV
jgi:uncharacterized protein